MKETSKRKPQKKETSKRKPQKKESKKLNYVKVNGII
jgi:hypothetical protein